ncbi:cubilin-like [Pecten maximus]|uniref:cubilin-like n=1 Tax=Pecten maximus TaxID=6579 RepID=UPI001458A89B|nr:cubilin-like [Pecten maximus]
MKKGSVLILVGVCLAIVTLSESVFLDACGGQYNTTVETPISVNFSAISNQTCVWYIKSDKNTSTNLYVSFSLPTTNSTVTVYSGHYQSNSTKATVIKTYKAGDTVSEELVISADKVTSIVFHNKNTTQGSLHVTYNADECTNRVEWARPIVSPVYLPGTGPVTCVYQMTLPSDRRTSVMSFTDFSLVKGSLLVQNGNISHSLTGIILPDDLLLGTTGNLSLTIALNNNSALQHFKAFMTEADPGCTRKVNFNDSLPYHFTLPSDQSLPLDCLVIVTAPINTTLVTIVQDLVLPGGSNSVILRDGGSQASQEISTLLSSSQSGQLIVTSGNKLFIQIRLEKSLQKSTVNLDFKPQGGGAGRYHGSGKLSLDASHFTNNNSVYFLVTVPDGRAQVTFVNGKIKNATLEVFDDNTPSKEIAVFKKVSDFYTITGSGQSILIKANNFLGVQTFTASYNTIRPDCDQLSTGPYETYSMIGKSGTQCTWSIKPQISAWLLDMTMGQVRLCQNDTLALYEGLTKAVKKPIITLNAKTQNSLVPTIYSQSQNGFRLVLNSPKGSCSKNNSAIVTSSYQTNMAKCGGTLNACPTGIVNSPQFPNQYPINAHCKWTFIPNKKLFILVSVGSLDLNPKHSLTVDDGKKKMSLAGYTDVDLLLPTTNKSNLVLDFNSVNPNTSGVPTTGNGFTITYTYFDCGEKIIADKSGKIDISSKAWNTSRLCIWQIQAPSPGKANNSNILSLNISITGNTTWDVVTILDGGSRQSPLLELSGKGKSVNNTLTRGPYVMVVFRHTIHTSELAANSTFQLKLSYTTYPCPSTQKCQNGLCIHPDWYCNGVNNCGDNTDELNCTYPVPIVPTTTPKSPKSGKSSGVKSYVVVIVALICLALGIVLAIAVPAMYKRIKYPNYRHLQDLSVTT